MIEDEEYWHRVHLLERYEYARRTRVLEDAQCEVGELVHVPGGTRGTYDSLVRQSGVSWIRYNEQQRDATYNISKFCVVLDRIDRERYVVCYLTTWNRRAVITEADAPRIRHFSLAACDSPEWPKGFAPLRFTPKRAIRHWVFGIPVERSIHELSPVVSSARYMLQAGELDRLTAAVRRNVQYFMDHLDDIRHEEEMRWREDRRHQFVDRHEDSRHSHMLKVRDKPTDEDVHDGFPADIYHNDTQPHIFRKNHTLEGSREEQCPVALHVQEYRDLRIDLLRFRPHMTTSSPALNDLTVTKRKPRWQLPPPAHYQRQHVVSMEQLFRFQRHFRWFKTLF